MPHGIRSKPPVATRVIAGEWVCEHNRSCLRIWKSRKRRIHCRLVNQIQKDRSPSALGSDGILLVATRGVLSAANVESAVMPGKTPKQFRQSHGPGTKRCAKKPDCARSTQPIPDIDPIVCLAKPPSWTRKRRRSEILVFKGHNRQQRFGNSAQLNAIQIKSWMNERAKAIRSNGVRDNGKMSQGRNRINPLRLRSPQHVRCEG